MKVLYLVKLTALALILWIINIAFATWSNISYGRVGLMILFLSFIYMLFNLIYDIIRKFLEKEHYITGYVSLLSLKLIVTLVLAFLILGPDKIENKFEALFFLVDYFVFLMFDVTWKVRYINKKYLIKLGK